jgi:hypothetical protein
MINNRAFIKSAIFSDYFTPFFTSTNSIETEDRDCDIKTPPSSVCDEIPFDLEIFYQILSISDLDDIKMVDLTGVHDILEPKYFITAIIESAY